MTGKSVESEKQFEKLPAAAKGEVSASPVPSFNPANGEAVEEEAKEEDTVKVKKKPGPKPGFKRDKAEKKVFGLKADGTPKKKPGPKPGSKRKPGPKPVLKVKLGSKGFKRKPGRPKQYNGAIGEMIETTKAKIQAMTDQYNDLSAQITKAQDCLARFENMAEEASALGL